jgi:hypothetical protein
MSEKDTVKARFAEQALSYHKNRRIDILNSLSNCLLYNHKMRQLIPRNTLKSMIACKKRSENRRKIVLSMKQMK